MSRHLLTVAILLLWCQIGLAQSYGLTFNSHEVMQEKRTSLDLSPGDSLRFSGDFDLDFDFRFVPNYSVYFGYILRMITGDKQNIDLIFNQKGRVFKLITGENFTGAGFMIDSVKSIKEWNRFTIKCNLEKHTIELYVNGMIAIHSRTIPMSNCFRFLWGANDYSKFKTRDIPPMQIRDIRIFEQGRLKYYWPLDETSGNLCMDKENGRKGAAVNPTWIKPRHQQWERAASFTLDGYASAAFDNKNDRLFITGSDSLATYSTSMQAHPMTTTANPHHEFILGHQALYDTLHNQLLDLFIDEKKIYPYNLSSRQWTEQPPHNVTEYWHANKLVSTMDSSVYVFGGYGQLTYKNLVQRYSPVTQRWDTIKPTGNFFSPRYLAALGTDETGRYAYILGGYGSISGDQMLDPFNNYDLMRFDLRTWEFKKLFSLHPANLQFTFANSLIIPKGSSDYFGLIFRNDSFKSSLQLIKGSLKDSSYQLMASQIPYSFHDIRSYADLYYSRSTNQLIAVTLLYSREDEKAKKTEVNIYTLDFPPEQLTLSEKFSYVPSMFHLWVWPGIAVLALAGIFIYFKKNRKRIGAADTGKAPLSGAHEHLKRPATEEAITHDIKPYPTAPVSMVTDRYPAIYLFGQFQVIDREGHDITRLFTPLLKELFLIIVINSYKNKRGITSQGLTDILWHDKSPKDAMNNRSVNITKLKAILEKLGHCSIGKESGAWEFHVQENGVYVDYQQFGVMSSLSHQDPEYVRELLEIIRRGPLLTQTEYNWLDNIKSEISNEVIEICLGFLKEQDIAADPDLVLNITNYIFYFDPLNEEALGYKCKTLVYLKRHSLAKTTYVNFTKDFKNSYGEEFRESFNEVIAHQPY